MLESQRVRITTLDKWDPSWLPEPHQGRAVPRSETLVGLIFTTTFLLWWTDLLARADYWINQGIKWSLLTVMVVCLFEALTEIWHTMKARREVVI